jgi:hypothetical protein
MRSLEINRKERIIKIRFSPSFYSKATLLDSIKDFEGLCTGNLKTEGMEFVVDLICRPEIPAEGMEKIGHEFCNYALGNMKNKSEV